MIKREVGPRPGGAEAGAGDFLCSATAVALRWILLEDKGLAGKTPPVRPGEEAAKFPQPLPAGETLAAPFVPSLPK